MPADSVQRPLEDADSQAVPANKRTRLSRDARTRADPSDGNPNQSPTDTNDSIVLLPCSDFLSDQHCGHSQTPARLSLDCDYLTTLNSVLYQSGDLLSLHALQCPVRRCLFSLGVWCWYKSDTVRCHLCIIRFVRTCEFSKTYG